MISRLEFADATPADDLDAEARSDLREALAEAARSSATATRLYNLITRRHQPEHHAVLDVSEDSVRPCPVCCTPSGSAEVPVRTPACWAPTSSRC